MTVTEVIKDAEPVDKGGLRAYLLGIEQALAALQGALDALAAAVSPPFGSGKIRVASPEEAGTGAGSFVMTAELVAVAIAALAPKPAFTKSYESGPQVITAAGALTLAHGLGTPPKLVQAWLKCLTDQHGYVVGEEVLCDQTTTNNVGCAIVPDATNLAIRFGSATGVFTVVNKATGATATITPASWALVIRAWA